MGVWYNTRIPVNFGNTSELVLFIFIQLITTELMLIVAVVAVDRLLQTAICRTFYFYYWIGRLSHKFISVFELMFYSFLHVGSVSSRLRNDIMCLVELNPHIPTLFYTRS